eukprot:TRINITY_DN9595_c0_g1_i3.p1 TRINITY_DN9595_c0_g1~~TRINITY_DN9595_c0_g1_i3.p1  ORF type:complete len:1242 (+),score=413.12 TRINITY_DN9595_c0_g1_i3:249-3974(+)
MASPKTDPFALPISAADVAKQRDDQRAACFEHAKANAAVENLLSKDLGEIEKRAIAEVVNLDALRENPLSRVLLTTTAGDEPQADDNESLNENSAQQDAPAFPEDPRAREEAMIHVVRKQIGDYRQLSRNLMTKEEYSAQLVLETPAKSYVSAFKDAITTAEFQLASRISYHINELQQLPANVSEDLQVKAMQQLHMLRVKDLQTKLRQEVEAFRFKNTSLRTAYRRTALMRNMHPKIRDAKTAAEDERREKARQNQSLRKQKASRVELILEHAERFRSFHSSVKRKLVKLANGVSKYVANQEKKRQAEQERLEKERLRLLMAQDTDGYRRLLDEKKDKRKRVLLERIDDRLGMINILIKSHQTQERAADGEHMDEAADNAEPSTDSVAAAKAAAQFDAHTVQEEIKEQPSILVGGTLKPYQLQGLQWLISLYNNKINGILADEMGLGKTIQTIALLTYLVEKKNNSGPFLIIVPLATLSNWKLELAKWAPSLNTLAFRGNKAERRLLHQQIRDLRFNVLLTTYEMIIRARPILSKVPWRYMIIDEGHRMKNPKNKLSQTLMEYFQSPRRLLLTGTPLQNNLPELWALLNFILPDIFNSSGTFDSWFSAPFADSEESMTLDAEEKHLIILQLHKILRPFLLRRLKKEVETQLPDKIEHVIKCDMSALQRKLYTSVQKYKVILSSGQTAGSAAFNEQRMSSLKNAVMHLRKLCCHPFLFPEVEHDLHQHLITKEGPELAAVTLNGLDLWRSAGKLELLERMLPKLLKYGHRVLLFSQFTTLLNILEDYLRYRGIQYCRMDGSTSADDRGELLKQFNAKDSPLQVFILSTRAGGLGLNLQTADTVVIFDSDWNPHQDLQAQDRAHRIGQTNEVRVFRLVTANSVEERMLERAREKLDVDNKVIQAGKFNQKSSEVESRQILLEIITADNGEEEEVDEHAGVTNYEELNRMLARSDEEYEAFMEMDNQLDADAAWKSEYRKERLMQKHELPEVISKSEEELKTSLESTNEPSVAARRERRQVNYDDDAMTELEFMKSVEAQAEQEEASKKKRRGRKKRTATEAVADSVATTAAASPAMLPEEQPFDHITAARSILAELMEATNRRGHLLSTNFMEVPDEAEDPLYHGSIDDPIDLTTISSKVQNQAYPSFANFRDDVELLVKNALFVQEEGSDIADDAEQLGVRETHGGICHHQCFGRINSWPLNVSFACRSCSSLSSLVKVCKTPTLPSGPSSRVRTTLHIES